MDEPDPCIKSIDLLSVEDQSVKGRVLNTKPILYHVLVFRQYRDYMYIDKDQVKGLYFSASEWNKIDDVYCSIYGVITKENTGTLRVVCLSLKELGEITFLIQNLGKPVFTKTCSIWKISKSLIDSIGTWSMSFHI